MWKKNYLVSLLMATILFAGCTNDDEPTHADLLKGTWVHTLLNGQPFLTDETFVMELRPDLTEMYAIGLQLDESNRSWVECTNYTYALVGDTIIINGTDVLNNAIHIKFLIKSLTNETMVLTVPTFSFNGIVSPNNNTYTMEKVTNDNSAAFTGVWYGRCTTEGAADSTYHYWEYLNDGRYNYYYQDEHNNWIKKADNQGRYYLYGTFMASNYSNDLLTGGTGQVFECWNVAIDGNNMEWTGLRANNITLTYVMDKVQSPPQTIQN